MPPDVTTKLLVNIYRDHYTYMYYSLNKFSAHLLDAKDYYTLHYDVRTPHTSCTAGYIGEFCDGEMFVAAQCGCDGVCNMKKDVHLYAVIDVYRHHVYCVRFDLLPLKLIVPQIACCASYVFNTLCTYIEKKRKARMRYRDIMDSFLYEFIFRVSNATLLTHLEPDEFAKIVAADSTQ
jgi:hypothetical protein